MRLFLLLPALLLSACAGRVEGGSPPVVAAQLYTVRDALAADLPGTLSEVHALGYGQVELAGLHGRSPAEVRTMLDRAGLTPVASHIAWERLRDDPEGALAETIALGSPAMVLAWTPPEARRSPADWDRIAAVVNRAGRLARARGVAMLYHNHDFEWTPVDGVLPFDRLLAGFDRSVVALELDLYWLALAGREPGEVFDAWPGGVAMIHLKDMAVDGTAMADAGTGRLPFQRWLSDPRARSIRALVVERDDAPDPLASLGIGQVAALRLARAMSGAPVPLPLSDGR